MQRPRAFPRWLRRGLEAGSFTAVLALGTLLGFQLNSGTGQLALPAGLAGTLLLAPPVLSLGVITVAYPVAFGATRSDSLLGSMAAYLIAADSVALLAGGRLVLEASAREVPMGLFVAGLGSAPALLGLAAGQLLTPLGFGRRAGAVTAIAAALAGVVFVIFATTVG